MTFLIFLVAVALMVLPRRESIRPNIRLYSQRTGNKTLLATPIEGDPNHVHTWSKCGEERKSIQGYACTGCRSIYNKAAPGTRRPLPMLKVDTTSGDLESLIPTHEHYCTPLDRDVVRGMEIRRGELAEVATTRKKPAAVRVNIAANVTTRYAPYGSETLANVAAAAKGTKKSNLARSVQRVRRTLYPDIMEFSDLDELPPKHSTFKLTLKGVATNDFTETHLLWKDENTAIFGCPYFITLFELVDELFLDGTFKYRPSCSTQLYRIFGLINDTVRIPLFTIAMNGSAVPDYEKVFNQVSLLIAHRPIRARYAHFDHESAAVIAFRNTPCFATVIPKMCVFHVRQGLHNRVKFEKITRIYNDEDDKFVKHFITRIGGLQLLPLNFVNEAVLVLQTYLRTQAVADYEQLAQNVEALERILNYYQTTWLGTHLGREFFTSSDLESNRTNNYAENYHGRQENYFTQTKPPLGLFMYDNRRLLNEEEQTVYNYLTGRETPPVKDSGADNKITAVKQKLVEMLEETNNADERSRILLKNLLKLGKLAGMSGKI